MINLSNANFKPKVNQTIEVNYFGLKLNVNSEHRCIYMQRCGNIYSSYGAAVLSDNIDGDGEWSTFELEFEISKDHLGSIDENIAAAVWDRSLMVIR